MYTISISAHAYLYNDVNNSIAVLICVLAAFLYCKCSTRYDI